jgi:hypothetical protein
MAREEPLRLPPKVAAERVAAEALAAAQVLCRASAQ